MNKPLSVFSGQHTSKGRKAINQDALLSCVPSDPSSLLFKGACFVCADGVSSSSVSQVASDQAVRQFIKLYYLSPESWSTQRSATQTIQEINANLYTKTRQGPFRYDIEKGYVCTFSALILKGQLAHIFHIGDSVVMRIRNQKCELLTQSHRVIVNHQQSYLGRALGASAQLDLDYHCETTQNGDIFILMTDGVDEFITNADLLNIVNAKDALLDINTLANDIIKIAYKNGSHDNLSIQIVQVDKIIEQAQIPSHKDAKLLLELPKLGDTLDGFLLERELHSSQRSHVYLAKDIVSQHYVALKIPATELQQDALLLQQFGVEEWIIRRINSPFVIAASSRDKPRKHVFMVTDYFQGQHLHQWILDNPNPSLEKVRDIVEQIGKGLMAMHHAQILHQDIRPENIMIDAAGNVKIIDMGAARVAGITELVHEVDSSILGTAMFTAPEYFLGDLGTEQSDLYSLAMLTYFLLSGRYAYGPNVAKCQTQQDLRKLQYSSVLDSGKAIPLWIDYALKQALQLNPAKRCETISEFLYQLRQPSPSFIGRIKAPIIERHPVRFWQVVALILFIVNMVLLANMF